MPSKLKTLAGLLTFLFALTLGAHAAPDRSVGLSNLSTVVGDVNEELTEIYTNLPQVLESVTGTNTYSASVAGMPPITAYEDGMKFRIKIPNTNTSTSTNLNIDGVGNISWVDRTGAAIPIGALASGTAYNVEYFGAPDNQFRTMSPLTTVGTPAHNFCVAVSDETTTLTTGAAKVTFNMPQAMTLTGVFAYLRTAATGLVTIDINEDTDAEGAGASATIMAATKLTIDANERRSSTAATAPVISDSALAQHSEMTIDIDSIASGSPNGLKVCFVGTFS